jgi:hypothetical protein
MQFLTSPPERGLDPDVFFKTRMSFVELFLRELDRLLKVAEVPPRPIGSNEVFLPVEDTRRQCFVWNSDAPKLRSALEEINGRLRRCGISFHYHNGYLQKASDQLTESVLDNPFWQVLRDPRWANVDIEIKEALDRRDRGASDAAFHAMKALESAIKVISDTNGWTTGKERGAANYIENLARPAAGPYIDSWEAEMLKELFRTLRNPQGHGAGSAPPLSLGREQTNWTIEAAMSWVKSLIQRG